MTHDVTLPELGVTRTESSRQQQVAAVPLEVRTEYVEETNAAAVELATNGLLQHADRAAAQQWAASMAPPETAATA